jgi:hypothetical protein
VGRLLGGTDKMKLENFFEKGYYINLDRRTDRNELFQKEMARVGLSSFFERVSAEDGIKEPDPMKRHAYCAYTYHKLFKKIYDLGYERVLIFEDDAFFYDRPEISGKELAEKAVDDLKYFPNWDMILLGGRPVDTVGPLQIVTDNLFRSQMVLGTHAVGYRRKVIKKVLDEYVPFQDGTIDGWYGNVPVIEKYLVNPLACGAMPVKSDLDGNGYISNVKDDIICYERVPKIDKRHETQNNKPI